MSPRAINFLSRTESTRKPGYAARTQRISRASDLAPLIVFTRKRRHGKAAPKSADERRRDRTGLVAQVTGVKVDAV